MLLAALTGCASAPSIPQYARNLGEQSAVVENLGEGVTLVALDATDSERWLYFDLDRADLVQIGSPETNDQWDIAFQRFHVKSNGGVSGPGGVQIAPTRSTVFDDPPDLSTVEWLQDESGSGERVRFAFAAQGNWFRYDIRTHSLSSRERVSYVQTTEGAVFKLQMVSYYDRLLISGFPTFLFSQVK